MDELYDTRRGKTDHESRSPALELGDPRQQEAAFGQSQELLAAAERGVAGAGDPLPYAEQIQASFGHHDVSQVQTRTGGKGAHASAALGAEAYALGDRIAFSQAPDLHTAAHEAAHTVQQRGGVQLKGGAGAADAVYEQHADRVADAVVQGRSAEGLLDRSPGSGGTHKGIQRRAISQYEGSTRSRGRNQSTKTPKKTHTGDALTTAYDSLLALFGALNNPGSADFGLDLGINFGIGKVASVSGTIKMGLTANMQDDRRLRIGGSIGFEVAAGFDLGFWEAKVGVTLTQKGTWVFNDVTHLCAWVAKTIVDYVEAAKKYVTAKAQDEARTQKRDLTPAEKSQMLAVRRKKAKLIGKAANAPTFVSTQALTVAGEAKAKSGFEGGVSGTASRSTFTRTNRQTGRKESTRSTETVLSASASYKGLSASISYTTTKGHANPDNDGTYLNITVGWAKGTEQDQSILQDAVAQVRSMVPARGQDPKVFGKKVLKKIHASLDKMGTSKKTTKTSSGIEVEFNWVDKGGWRLQYGRLNRAKSKSVELEIPVTAVTSLTGAASTSASYTIPGTEVMGSNTLTYAQTVFNGLNRRGSSGITQWRGWAAIHKAELWAIMQQSGRSGTNANTEAKDGAFKPFGDACEKAFKSLKMTPGKVDQSIYHSLFATMEQVFKAAGNSKQGWTPA